MRIIHLSDLHVTSGCFVREWGDAIVSYVNAVRPDVTVVTGDLTMEGHREEYEQARRFLARIQTGSLLVVPGNHDARNGGYVRFEEVFGTRYPTYEDDAVIICGIDSSQPDIDDGRVGRSSFVQIADTVSVDGKIRILAMHHHLIPVPGTGRESRTPIDVEEVLELCAETEMDLVLTGHGHRPYVCKQGGTHFLTAGTATLRRHEGRSFPSLNVITAERGTIYMQLVDVSGGWGTQTMAVATARPVVHRGPALTADHDRQARFTPPFAFEVEEFHSRLPEENWRHRHGVPQELDSPLIRTW